VVRRDVPLLAAAMPLIGHFQIRNRDCWRVDRPCRSGGGVPGGGAGSRRRWTSPGLGRRIVPADTFAKACGTALKSDELLVGVRFPVWGDGCRFAVEEVARRHGDFAMAGCARAAGRTATSSVGRRLVRRRLDAGSCRAAEAALVGSPTRGRRDRSRTAGRRWTGLPDDVHASGALRRQLAGTVVGRAVARVMREVGDA
jgi:carbon-monoxide dehydrogenase medium subunit